MAEADEAFLGVRRSLSGRLWREKPGDPRAGAAISQRLGLPEIVGRVLASRGVTVETAPRFLDPRLRTDLPDPSVLRDMDKAADRLADAVQAGEKVGIFADYDVDGATSAALLARFFRAVGVPTRIYVPDRLTEGYGPNREAMGTMRDEGLSLVVLVDCGTTSFEPLDHAREIGLECIVVDHHVAEARLPPAFAVVNPNRLDESVGGAVLGGLAAVGVTFLLLVALNRTLRRRGFHAGRKEPDLRRWLDLTALGTVADVAELAGVNRTLVSRGIDVLGRRGNPGIAALLDTAKVRDKPDSWHAGFVLGPRINAGGRIGDAGLGAALLASDDPDFAWRTAETLERLNVERREVEAEVLEAALRSSVPEPDDPYVFAAGGDWHPGVVGIVASRLVERFGRPALVASEGDGVLQGSARSVSGVSLGPVIIEARQRGLLISGGGHAMAAGFRLAVGNREGFESFLAERLGPLVPRGGVPRTLFIDGALTVAGADVTLMRELSRIAPFGRGNPEPRFALPEAAITFARPVGGKHVRAELGGTGKRRLKAIAFGAVDTPLGDALLDPGRPPLHITGSVRPDPWNGPEAVQFVVSDAAPVR